MHKPRCAQGRSASGNNSRVAYRLLPRRDLSADSMKRSRLHCVRSEAAGGAGNAAAGLLTGGFAREVLAEAGCFVVANDLRELLMV